MPFQVISSAAAKRMKSAGGEYNIKYVNRIADFKPNVGLVSDYEETQRRFKDKDDPSQYGREQFHNTYRHLLLKSGGTLGKIRELHHESKAGDVYLVNETNLPLIEAIFDIIKSMKDVWDK